MANLLSKKIKSPACYNIFLKFFEILKAWNRYINLEGPDPRFQEKPLLAIFLVWKWLKSGKNTSKKVIEQAYTCGSIESFRYNKP